MVIEYPVLVLDLIQSQMGLKDDHVFLYNQKANIPPVRDIFVCLSITGDHPFANNTQYVYNPVTDGLDQVQSVNVAETYEVWIYSVDGTARRRRHEVLWALGGTASQQLQEKHSFSIGRLPTDLTDISYLEGTARINRYSLTFRVTCAYETRKPVGFYDQFSIPPIVTTNQ